MTSHRERRPAPRGKDRGYPLPRDANAKFPADLPEALRACFKNGVLYLQTPKWEKDDAKVLGARWDWVNEKWWISVDMDWRKFRRWLPVPELPRHGPPKSIPAKVARYYLSLLEQANPDVMGNNKLRLDHLTFEELESGQLRRHTEVLAAFWNEAKKLQEASPFPLEPVRPTDAADGSEEPEPGVGIFLSFGFPAARRGGDRHVVLVLPAFLQPDGRLAVALDMLASQRA